MTRTSRTAKPAAKPAARKPARKGNVRTTDGPASPVRTRKLSASERKAGSAKLSKPTARRAAPKPTAKRAAKSNATTNAGNAGPSVATVRDAKAVAKLRAKGAKWDAIATETGFSLSRLARLRKFGKANGIAGFGG